jgi:alpha-1,2-mannosyltransferase
VAEVSARRSPLATWVIMVAGVAVLAGAVTLEWNSLFDPSRTKALTDIEYYRNALAAVAAGRPLFDVLGYPPFALIPITPLGWLPLRQAEQMWTIAGIVGAVLLAGLMVWLARRVAGRTPALPGPSGAAASVAMAAALLLISQPMLSQLANGQISLLVISLAFVDGCGLLPRRLQGSLVGIAGAIKLTPMIFVPYYLITGQRRQAATSTVSFFIATGIGFLLYPGDSFAFWTHLGSTTRFGELARLDNRSILGTLSRWIADPTGATFSWYALVAVVGAMALLRAREHFRRGEAVQATLVMGTASVALSPISWPHHQIWLALVALWLLWTPRVLDRVVGAGVLAVYSIGVNALYEPARDPVLLSFLVWEPQALLPVLICLTGLPHDRSREPNLPTAAPSHPAAVTPPE